LWAFALILEQLMQTVVKTVTGFPDKNPHTSNRGHKNKKITYLLNQKTCL